MAAFYRATQSKQERASRAQGQAVLSRSGAAWSRVQQRSAECSSEAQSAAGVTQREAGVARRNAQRKLVHFLDRRSRRSEEQAWRCIIRRFSYRL